MQEELGQCQCPQASPGQQRSRPEEINLEETTWPERAQLQGKAYEGGAGVWFWDPQWDGNGGLEHGRGVLDAGAEGGGAVSTSSRGGRRS